MREFLKLIVRGWLTLMLMCLAGVAVARGIGKAMRGDVIAYNASFGNYICNAHIALIDINTSITFQLTSCNESSATAFPAWSYDGTALAYCHSEGICTIDEMNNSEPRVLNFDDASFQNPSRLIFSPNGQHLAFLNFQSGIGYRLIVAEISGSNSHHLSEISVDEMTSSAWSPDGTQIAVTALTDNGYQVALIPTNENNQLRIITNDTAGLGARQPSWSPDGTRIVFTGFDGIQIMNSDGSNIQRVVNTSYADADPVWSPDGQKIAFAANMDGDFEIYVVDIDGNNLRQLTHNNIDDRYPAWQP
jgi:Tol biopolymer transport system component